MGVAVVSSISAWFSIKTDSKSDTCSWILSIGLDSGISSICSVTYWLSLKMASLFIFDSNVFSVLLVLESLNTILFWSIFKCNVFSVLLVLESSNTKWVVLESSNTTLIVLESSNTILLVLEFSNTERLVLESSAILYNMGVAVVSSISAWFSIKTDSKSDTCSWILSIGLDSGISSICSVTYWLSLKMASLFIFDSNVFSVLLVLESLNTILFWSIFKCNVFSVLLVLESSNTILLVIESSNTKRLVLASSAILYNVGVAVVSWLVYFSSISAWFSIKTDSKSDTCSWILSNGLDSGISSIRSVTYWLSLKVVSLFIFESNVFSVKVSGKTEVEIISELISVFPPDVRSSMPTSSNNFLWSPLGSCTAFKSIGSICLLSILLDSISLSSLITIGGWSLSLNNNVLLLWNWLSELFKIPMKSALLSCLLSDISSSVSLTPSTQSPTIWPSVQMQYSCSLV